MMQMICCCKLNLMRSCNAYMIYGTENSNELIKLYVRIWPFFFLSCYWKCYIIYRISLFFFLVFVNLSFVCKPPIPSSALLQGIGWSYFVIKRKGLVFKAVSC